MVKMTIWAPSQIVPNDVIVVYALISNNFTEG